MTTNTRTTTCPECGRSHEVQRIFIFGSEKFANAAVTCNECGELRDTLQRRKQADDLWTRLWESRMPRLYQQVIESAIDPDLMCEHCWMDWTGDDPHWGGIGVIGGAGAGKSSAVACLVRRLKLPFLWLSGPEARQLSLDMAMGDQSSKAAARTKWEHCCKVPLLVLDDVSQAKITEAWASSLFDLLETRIQQKLPSFWTSQLDPETLQQKIESGSGDPAVAQAIVRRLTQHSLIIQQNLFHA